MFYLESSVREMVMYHSVSQLRNYPHRCVGHLWDNRRFTLFRDNYSDEPVVLSQIEGLSHWSPTIRAVFKLAEHSAWPAHL